MELLEVGWTWRSLLRRKPELILIHAQSGHIRLHQDPELRSGEGFNLPELSLKDVMLEDLHLELFTGGDTLIFHLKGLDLTRAMVGEQIMLDSFLLDQASFAHVAESMARSTGPVSSGHSTPAYFLENIPHFEINYLELHQCGLLMERTEGFQRVDNLDLVLNGWKSSELLSVSLDRLDFLYQDTLEMELVLENGEVNNAFQTRLTDFGFNIPGASIQVAEARADLRDGYRLTCLCPIPTLIWGGSGSSIPGSIPL